MIGEEKLGDALDATESFLLVPTPVGATTGFEEGFISQVIEAYPEVGKRLVGGGVSAGDVLFVGHMERGRVGWLPKYTLALAGIHYREPNGWNEAADMLRIAMDKIQRKAPSDSDQLAIAGIPGTGFSGVRGNSSMSGIEEVLRNHPMDVVIYRRTQAGVRAKVLATNPPKHAAVEVLMPKAFAERHPVFSHPEEASGSAS